MDYQIENVECLAEYLGRTLDQINLELLEFKGDINREHPLVMEFVFTGNVSLTISGTAFGESIRLNERQLQAVDMDEYGSIIIETSAFMSFLKGRRLSGITAYETVSGSILPGVMQYGLCFDFSGKRISVYGVGDELHVERGQVLVIGGAVVREKRIFPSSIT